MLSTLIGVPTYDASGNLIGFNGVPCFSGRDLLAQAGTTEQESVIAPGALSTVVYKTLLSVDGTDAFTLAAPTWPGQRKLVVCVAAANTPAGTLTVTSPDDTSGFVCPATFFFDNVGQTLEFEATSGLKWRCIRKVRTGVKTLVLATTTTTGICDMSHVNVTVDGTKASTGSKALPDGAAVGELLAINCSAAINTPHGDLDGTFVSSAGVAGTRLDDFAAAGNNAFCMWTGAAWQVLNLAGATLAVA